MGHDSVLDPSRDLRDAVAELSGVGELPDKIWFHRTAAAVIDAGRCVRCGTCVAACPSGSISVAADRLPTLVRMCTGCSSCWDFCPLAGLRTDEFRSQWLGLDASATLEITASQPAHANGSAHAPSAATPPVLAAYEARAREPFPSGGQDGGVVTALLAALLVRGDIDGALVSRRSGPLFGETVLATSSDELRACAGSVYDQSFPLARLAEGLPAGIDSVALVGTGCQITGLRALQRFPWPYRQAPVDRVSLAVGLFCTRSFDPQRLALALVRQGVDLGRVAKVDIRDGRFRALDADGDLLIDLDVRVLHSAALAGCDECDDFGAALADISVGNVGSRPGYTTVLLRTKRGAQAWQQAQDALEVHPLADLERLSALAAGNERRAARASHRPRSEDGALWVHYGEHLAAYQGTDRAPAQPPPHRSHHYTTSC